MCGERPERRDHAIDRRVFAIPFGQSRHEGDDRLRQVRRKGGAKKAAERTTDDDTKALRLALFFPGVQRAMPKSC